MLQTIEIEIDDVGKFHAVKPLNFEPKGRALLTLLDPPEAIMHRGLARRALELLSEPRYANRPAADANEVRTRISNLRDEWSFRP